MKQIPSPPFWGGVRVKKWSPFFDSGARSPIFGHLKMGTFSKSEFYYFVACHPKVSSPRPASTASDQDRLTTRSASISSGKSG